MSTSSTTSASPGTSSGDKADTYSELFPLSEKATIILRSSDGTLFATKKFFLEAASPVFEDILEIGAEGKKRDGKPLVRLDETANDLEPFLRLLHRDQLLRKGEPPDVSIELLERLSPLVDKYQTTNLAWVLYERCLPSLLVQPGHGNSPEATDVPCLLALAVIHEKETAAKAALRNFGEWFVPEKGDTVWAHGVHPNADGRKTDRRYFGQEDVSLPLLRRLPPTFLATFVMLHRKVSNRPDYSWKNAADDFKVRHPSPEDRPP